MKYKCYEVPCPYCGAEQGLHCFQLSHYKRTGERKWFQPHSARERKFKAEKEES